jgi:hypothetical protein
MKKIILVLIKKLNFQSLNYRSNRFGDQGAIKLSEGVSKLHNLIFLNLNIG